MWNPIGQIKGKDLESCVSIIPGNRKTGLVGRLKPGFKRFMLGVATAFLIGCATAKAAKADFVIGTPMKVPNVNSSVVGDCDSCVSSDGLELYFRRDTPGWNWNIWVAKRPTIFHTWEEPKDLGPPVNVRYHTEGPSISADGLELYFSSSRPGAIGWTGVDTDYDIWMARRETKQSLWQEPVNLGAPVNTASWELFPSISSDGLELYFSSNGSGSYVNEGIWVAKRETKDSPWGHAKIRGLPINPIFHSSHLSISSDGLGLYFTSGSWLGSYGKLDIWVTHRASKDSPWREPVNLGPIINTSLDESGSSISAKGDVLFFDRFEGPGYRYSDIWQVSINPVLDFNNDEIVDAEDLFELEQNMFQSNPKFDIAPPPFGDGKVDANDLDAFFYNMFKEPGLMAYWDFNEAEGDIAHDFINSHNGVLHGNPIWRPDVGLNGALELDGDDYISVPYIWSPSNGGFIASAWVKGGGPGQSIIAQKSSDLMQGATWLGLSQEGKLMTGLAGKGRLSGPLLSDYLISDGNWHKVGVEWDGNQRYLYVDDVEVAKDIREANLFESPSTGLHFGAGKSLEQGSFWTGLIDDLKIYNSELAKEQRAPIDCPKDFAVEDFESFSFNNVKKFPWVWLFDLEQPAWYITDYEGYSGECSAASGRAHDKDSSIHLRLNCIQGDITFYRKVSSQAGHDYLIFYIDGIEKGRWSGEQDWTRESFPVEAGARTFKWVYSKDSSVSEGYDKGWIDDITFPIECGNWWRIPSQ